MVIFGGAAVAESTADLYLYNYVTSIWQEGPSDWTLAPFGYAGHTAVVTDSGLMLVFGGRQNNLLIYDIITSTWKQITQFKGTAPTPRTHHSAVMLDSNTMAVFGGIEIGSANKILGDLALYHVDEEYWVSYSYQHTSIPSPRHSHAAVTMGSNMYILGGIGSDGHMIDTDELLIFKSGTKSWSVHYIGDQIKPQARRGSTVVATPYNTILKFGGECPERQMQSLTSCADLWELVIADDDERSIETQILNLRMEVDNNTSSTTSSSSTFTSGSTFLTTTTAASSSQIREMVYPSLTTGLVFTVIALFVVVIVVSFILFTLAKLYVRKFQVQDRQMVMM